MDEYELRFRVQERWELFGRYVKACVKLDVLTVLTEYHIVRFEVFTAVTMKNGVVWDVTPCGSCKNRRFGGT
jgi:hypothetical protein